MAATSRHVNINEEDSLSGLTSMSISVQRKKQQQQQQKMTHRALRQYITDAYGSGKTESEKEFIITLNKYGDFSLGLLVVYIFSMWAITTAMATPFYKSIANVVVVRCRIPALEECFNFSQVLNISVKNRELIMTSDTMQYCRYDVRDYADLTKRNGCNYTSIISKIANASVRETRPCEEFVASVMKITPKTYYEWYCEKSIRYQVLIELEPHAEFFLTGLLATIADLYGRKRAFIVGSSLHMVGYLITLLPSQWCLYLGVTVASSGRGILFSSLYVLTLELCSNALVVWMGVLFCALYAFIRGSRVVLDYTIRHWIYEQLIIIAMSLVLPFGMWYINESPRWLMFTGNKPGAWKALMEWESDVQPDNSDMYTPISEKPSLINILKFFYKPQFRKRITAFFMLWLLYFICKYQIGPVIVAPNDPDYINNYVITISLQSAVILLANIIAAKYGRKRTICTLYCISTPLNAIVFMQNLDHEKPLVSRVVLPFLDALKVSEHYILLLYTSEMFPTPYRVTALNICLVALMFGYVLQLRFEIFRPTSQGLMYMPIFLASIASMFILYFLPETKNEGLPDTPRDAIYLTTVH